MWRAVSTTAAYWSATLMCWASLMSELPPMAMTMVFILNSGLGSA